MAGARGIDVSNYAGQFNWTATSGLSFGICRASQGLGAPGTNSPDPFLAWNWPRIKAKGLARGAYHFLDPGLSGAAQARYFVDTVSAVGLLNTDMLWMDNETAGASVSSVAACARDFMSTLVSLRPHNPRGVYSYWNFITSGNCAGLEIYPLWLAIFQSTTPGAPAPWKSWKFWQSGSTPTFDDDVFNGTAAELDAWIRSYQQEVEVQSGQLNNGANAVTVITVPWGSGSNIAFGCDNGIQGLPPASLRVAVYDTQWHITDNVTVSATTGQTVVKFPNPGKTGVVSVKRQDAGDVIVGYEVSLSWATMIVIVAGVSGSGKTTVGAMLAGRLNWKFADADDFHPEANVAKMRAGVPLTDEDRWPWLLAIAAWMDERIAAGESAVVTCSALRRAYRAVLLDGRPSAWVMFLWVDRELLAQRLATRHAHFFPPALLGSQLAAVERPGPDEQAVIIDEGGGGPAATVDEIVSWLYQLAGGREAP